MYMNLIALFCRQDRDVAPWLRAFAHGAMGRWSDPSWGGPIELFLVPASAPRRGMCYPVCLIVHIKEPLLLIGKSSPCGSFFLAI